MRADDLFPESIIKEIAAMYEGADPAHDFTHILRVYKNARAIGEKEGADMQVLLLAALLHDTLEGPKLSEGNPDSDETVKQKGKREKIFQFLERIGLSSREVEEVLYAVGVHRFSDGIEPETLEAKILQDADRLDAMGAVGIARVFMTGGGLGRMFYNPRDPFCRAREPDDRRWNMDHFYRKLLKLESGMHTRTAREIASRRAAVMKRYLDDLEGEIEEDLRQGY